MVSRGGVIDDFVEKLLKACDATVGWQEDPRGSNDAPFIKTWLADVGIYKPAPWCAAGTHAMFEAAAETLDCNNPHQKTASTQALWRMIPSECKRATPLAGSLYVFAHLTLGGQRDGHGHCGIVREILPSRSLKGWEGNTNAEKGRDGWIVAEHTWRWGGDGIHPVLRGRLELLGFADLASLVNGAKAA